MPVIPKSLISLSDVEESARKMQKYITHTPVNVLPLRSFCGEPSPFSCREGRVYVKLENLQQTSSFKVRGALHTIMQMTEEEKALGVIAPSGGNHALGVCYAARIVGTEAILILPADTPQERIQKCLQWGGQIVYVKDMKEALEKGKAMAVSTGKRCILPSEGLSTLTGAATVAWEFHRQVPQLDLLLIAAGGGGLCAASAAISHQIAPQCRVYGVEPSGSDVLYRSMRSGRREHLETHHTIADSLKAPYAGEIAFSLCQYFLTDVLRVEEKEIRRMMRYLFFQWKVVVEPSAAVALAALMGSLGKRVEGKNIGVILCGANIDIVDFQKYIACI